MGCTACLISPGQTRGSITYAMQHGRCPLQWHRNCLLPVCCCVLWHAGASSRAWRAARLGATRCSQQPAVHTAWCAGGRSQVAGAEAGLQQAHQPTRHAWGPGQPQDTGPQEQPVGGVLGELPWLCGSEASHYVAWQLHAQTLALPVIFDRLCRQPVTAASSILIEGTVALWLLAISHAMVQAHVCAGRQAVQEKCQCVCAYARRACVRKEVGRL